MEMNRAMALVTFLRVLSATFSGFRIARLTVAIDTPASLATSSIVADFLGGNDTFGAPVGLVFLFIRTRRLGAL